jgi:hypothetical protein
VNYLYKTSGLTKPGLDQIDLELCLVLLNSNTNTLDPSQAQLTQQQQQQQQQQTATTTLITLKETEEELIGTQNTVELQQLPKRLLTLKYYNIQNGSFVNLCYKPSVLQQQQQSQHVYMSTLSMGNEYSIYAAGSDRYRTMQPAGGPSPSPPAPPPPPPQMFQMNRYHLVRPAGKCYAAGYDSASSTSTAESQVSTLSNKETNNNNNNNKKKSKQYEKLLTVKSQDSAATGTTTTTTTTCLLLSDASSTAGNYAVACPSPLTRLLINKGTLQPFVDQFIEALFANTSNLPPVVQHLFEFFDQETRKYQHLYMHSKQPADELNALARSWKTNTYLIRYWANLIRQPDLLLDCHKSPAIAASLNCIAQAFEDSSAGKPPAVDNDTPIDRLLFIRDMPRYKQMTDRFFNEISSYQAISDHELHFYLNEFSKCQQQVQHSEPLGQTVTNSTPSRCSADVSSLQVLTQLYEYYERLEQPVNALLGQQQCSVLLPVHHRLVQIKELLASSGAAHTMPMTLNRIQFSQNTLNPYQQPVNCYATAPATVTGNDLSNSNQNTSFIINNQNFLFSNNSGGMIGQSSATTAAASS